jgi:adenosylcobyric acid synthase
MMEEICGVPVLGVVPYLTDVHIEEEDSVALAGKSVQASREAKVNVAVVLLRHLSNFTDFYSLEQDPRIHLFYTNNTDELRKADIIVVPGSKSTIDDLRELRQNGAAQAILQAHRQGATVIGICGGYQMMGLEVHDPEGVEGDCRNFPGLGLLPVRTVLTDQKTTRQVKFRFREDATPCAGYEIHMGRTEAVDGASPSCHIQLEGAETKDGYYVDERCWGTYIHGILDNPSIVDALLKRFESRVDSASASFDYQAFKEQQYDLLAQRVRECIDMERIYQCLQINSSFKNCGV